MEDGRRSGSLALHGGLERRTDLGTNRGVKITGKGGGPGTTKTGGTIKQDEGLLGVGSSSQRSGVSEMGRLICGINCRRGTGTRVSGAGARDREARGQVPSKSQEQE